MYASIAGYFLPPQIFRLQDDGSDKTLLYDTPVFAKGPDPGGISAIDIDASVGGLYWAINYDSDDTAQIVKGCMDGSCQAEIIYSLTDQQVLDLKYYDNYVYWTASDVAGIEGYEPMAGQVIGVIGVVRCGFDLMSPTQVFRGIVQGLRSVDMLYDHPQGHIFSRIASNEVCLRLNLDECLTKSLSLPVNVPPPDQDADGIPDTVDTVQH